MKKTLILIVIVGLAAPLARGQAEKTSSAFGIALSGYVKTDVFFDTRQTVNIREGHFLLYPKGPLADPDGNDISRRAGFNILSIQTRLAVKITGPDALGAKTSATIEGEFFGTSDADINGFRLRHAYLKLNWPTSELLIGQFWHPMFITESYPDVVSFNTGAPFQPFNRSPQIRYRHDFGAFSLTGTVVAQRDFVSPGPDGPSSSYLRNGVLPELNLKAQVDVKNETAGTESLAGAGIDYLRLAPRLATATGYTTDEKVGGFAAMAYVKQRWPKLTVKAEGVYGRDLYHLTMLGGYAVDGMTDPERQYWDYTPIDVVSVWAEVQTNGAPWQTGVFAGWSRNLGVRHALVGLDFDRGFNIAELYRVSPRLLYNVGKLRFAGEVEVTGAAYGTPNVFDKVNGATFVTNVRLLFAAYYFF